jgi:hypothetical protein
MHEQPAVGTYWTHPDIVDQAWDGLAIIVDIDDQGMIHLRSPHSESSSHVWTVSPSEFHAWTPVPDGHQRRQALISSAMHAVPSAVAMVGMTELGASPHVAPARIGSSDQHDASRGLMSHQDVERMSASIQDVRAKAKALAEHAKRQKQIMLMATREQMDLMNAMEQRLAKQMQRMSMAITALQGYLGSGIDIIDICRDGQPAPDADPIHIHQSVAFMDEEMAIEHAHHGGLTVDQVDLFDAWLMTPRENTLYPGSPSIRPLDVFLPYPKGVLGLRVSRMRRTSGDERLDESIHELERHLHLIIRNGDRVCRMVTRIPVRDTLYPTVAESDTWFRDHSGNPLRPGSEAFSRAMDIADIRQRQALIYVLIIQGILDRTTLLGSHDETLSMTDPSTWNGRVVMVRDAEPDPRAIGDGRPSWDVWKRQHNEALAAGERIVVGGGSWECVPAKALGPASGSILPVSMRHGRMCVVYERNESIWKARSCTEEDPKRKATAYMTAESSFLRLDGIDLDDLMHYRHARHERRSYLDMIPMIDAAITALRSEQASEDPFIDLVVRQGIPPHPDTGSRDDRSLVREVLDWWKHKTSVHRGVASDDAKALRMVHAQACRERQAVRMAASPHGKALADLMPEDGLVAIIQSGDDACILSRNIEGSPWVTKTSYVWKHDTWVSQGAPERCVPKRSSLRGSIVVSHRDWSSWPCDVPPSHVLDTAEKNQVIAAAIAVAEGKAASYARFRDRNAKPSWSDIQQALPLWAVYHGGKHGASITVVFHHGVPDPSRGHGMSSLLCITMTWKRRGETIEPRMASHHFGSTSISADHAWDRSYKAAWDLNHAFKQWPENIAIFLADKASCDAAVQVHRTHGENLRDQAMQKVSEAMKPWIEKERQAFIDAGHDPETWNPDRNATLRSKREALMREHGLRP